MIPGRSRSIKPDEKKAIKAKIVALMNEGQSKATAAQLAGITFRTFCNWVKKDDKWAEELGYVEKSTHRLIAEAKLWEKVTAGSISAIMCWLNNNVPEKYKYGDRGDRESSGGKAMVIRTPLRGPELPLPKEEVPRASDSTT